MCRDRTKWGRNSYRPFAGIIRIRFNGSAALPRRPLSLYPLPAVTDHRDNGPGWLPEQLENRPCRPKRQAGENGKQSALNVCMQEKGNYELVEPFDMDDATLADLSPQLAFILGVEYQILREKLKSGRPFTTLCLPQNAARLVKMAEHHERFVEDRPRVFAGWTEIFVGDEIA